MKNIKPIKLLKVLSFLLLFTTLSCVESDQFISEASDTDGDGILNSLDEAPNDPCLPAQQMEYTGFDVFNEAWASADCDGDGISNGAEFEDKTRNPFLDENTVDTDGDGVADFLDEDANDPCLPLKEEGYVGFNSDNALWLEGDCDGDTIPNGVEFANGTDPYKACNLNFDITNYVKELRTVDSNNGEGVTIGVIGEECGVFNFTGGGIFNQGCFNDDVSIPFVFTPSSSDSSNGTVSVSLITYSCLSEDGTSTIEYTVEGVGTYSGASSTVELTYTITQLGDDVSEEEREVTGTLIIRPLS